MFFHTRTSTCQTVSGCYETGNRRFICISFHVLCYEKLYDFKFKWKHRPNLLKNWTCFTIKRCHAPTWMHLHELIEKNMYFSSSPMTCAFLSVNCSDAEGRHIGETDADLKKSVWQVDNLKRDLVAAPSSFRMAMSCSCVSSRQPLWTFFEATLNVSSRVSPSLPSKIKIFLGNDSFQKNITCLKLYSPTRTLRSDAFNLAKQIS